MERSVIGSNKMSRMAGANGGLANCWRHNHTVFELPRRRYRHGRAMLILPIQV